MGKLDRKLKRRMQKRQMRVIEGDGKKAAQDGAAATNDAAFDPLVRFDLTMGSFLKEYMRLERDRPVEDRIDENGTVQMLLRFAAGVAISADIDDEMFLRAAEVLYEKERESYERKGDPA